MRGKVVKKLRKIAEATTKGQEKFETRRVYRQLKKIYTESKSGK